MKRPVLASATSSVNTGKGVRMAPAMTVHHPKTGAQLSSNVQTPQRAHHVRARASVGSEGRKRLRKPWDSDAVSSRIPIQ